MSLPRTVSATVADRAGGPQTYCTFRLGDGLFGTDTNLVKEVTALPPVTPIPQAPAAVRGYVNLRGHIVLVVDLPCLLQREPATLSPDSRLVVFKPELGDAFGVLVDRIGDIVELHADQIERHHVGNVAAGSENGRLPEEELIHGVGKLAGELLLILDAYQLRPCLAQAVARRGQAPARYRNEVLTEPPQPALPLEGEHL
jgi:purine-binding chemotaxis protein CheW